jgi:hypothetical protein
MNAIILNAGKFLSKRINKYTHKLKASQYILNIKQSYLNILSKMVGGMPKYYGLPPFS